jgi:hypothetical protein
MLWIVVETDRLVADPLPITVGRWRQVGVPAGKVFAVKKGDPSLIGSLVLTSKSEDHQK